MHWISLAAAQQPVVVRLDRHGFDWAAAGLGAAAAVAVVLVVLGLLLAFRPSD